MTSDEILILIANDKIDDAINEIIALAMNQSPQLNGQAALLKSRLVNYHKSELNGTNYIQDLNQIRVDVKNLLDLISSVSNSGGKFTYNNTKVYLEDRIKSYESPVSGLRSKPSIDFQNTTFNLLKRKLLEQGNEFKNPFSIKVKGTIFPSALLSTGWWERLDIKDKEFHKWKDGLQNWLFLGFDLWGPSWDFSWHSFENDYAIAQFGDGEEANTIPVIIPKDIAIKLKSSIENSDDPWGGKEVKISGVLGHKRHFVKKINKIDLVGGLMDYCIFLDSNNSKHKIDILDADTEIYSGYLWKCVIPKLWKDKNHEIKLDDVYFIWEHTDFTKKDALKYNLDSLNQKERYIENLYGPLILLQKSSNHVPDKPLWLPEMFCNFLKRNTINNV